MAIDVTYYGKAPVPVWVLKKIVERLSAVGCLLNPLKAVKSAGFRVAAQTKTIKNGSIVIEITKIR